MKTIGIAKFKEQCLSLLDQLEPGGLMITKHGKPIAVVRPYFETSADLIGSLEGKIEVRGDIFSTGLDWNADAKTR